MENKEEQINRDYKITVKVTESERERIKQNAFNARMSMSEYVRSQTLVGGDTNENRK